MKRNTNTPPKREVRTLASKLPLTVRTTPDGSKQVSGYAIVFNSSSVDLGGFTEICAPSMLNRTLNENPDVLALRDHKSELLLGRTAAGTLDLRTDSKGLAFTVTLPKTAIGDDTAENVRLGNLSGCSFGFSVPSGGDSWAADSDGNVVRTLQDIDLFEISVTSFPAYKSTSVNTRSCPASLRKKLKLDPSLDDIIFGGPGDDDAEGSDNDGSDDDSDGDECRCSCAPCEEGDCEDCTEDCTDNEDCLGCPSLDDTRADKLRVRKLFALRMK